MISRTVGILGEWEKANEAANVEMKQGGGLNKVWKPPERGCYKINSDAAMCQGKYIGLGGIVRDFKGDVMLATCARSEGDFSVDIAEALALRHV